MAEAELTLCVVCSMDMTLWRVVDREMHLNVCLDNVNVVQRYVCPTCNQELSQYDERRRLEHVNLCLDRVEDVCNSSSVYKKEDREDEDVQTQELELTQVAELMQKQKEQEKVENRECSYVCKICGVDMSDIDLIRRIRHVNMCGQKFGVRAADMTAVEKAETIAVRLEEIKSPDAFAIMTNSSSAKNMQTKCAGIDRSNVFDVLMRGSQTDAVLNARKRSMPLKFTRKAIKRRSLLCPEYKCIRGTDPPFIVDGFQYACKQFSSIYFLTHFHSDHYGGITKDFDCGVIYCNEITAKLVVQELGVHSKYVHPVGINTPVLVGDVQVTFMDANHCPGSAIILFRLKDGKAYLHTGDFRYHKDMLGYPALQPYIPTGNETVDCNGKIVGIKRLEGVYLDTTYCNPKYTFPTQKVAVEHTFKIMKKHSTQERVLYLFGSYTIGKERMFMEIARRLQKKVCVSKAKLRIIETFGWPNEEMQLLTTESSATNLHVVRMQDLQMDNLIMLLAKHRLRIRQIVAFRPTGWTYNSKNSQEISTCCTDPSGKIFVYGIPYSEHSSFAELCDFVKVMNPRAIIPTVNCSTKRNATKQVNALRQVAFHNIMVLFKQQRQQIMQ